MENPFNDYGAELSAQNGNGGTKEKRFFWLKLKEGFFDDKYIKIIRTMDNGYRILSIYLMLQLKALKTEGFIEYTALLPSFDAELAIIIGESEENVSEAVQILEKCGLIEFVDSKTVFMSARKELLDYGTEGASAARMRKFRDKQEASQSDKKVTHI